MIKYLFILINSLCLYLFGVFSGGNGVKISSNFPVTLGAGKEAEVEIRINKGNLDGFGRLQLEVPEGLSIKSVDDQGASFGFEENKARWLWAALPKSEEIVIKLVVAAAENISGEKLISGKFSFVENNEKQFTDLEAVAITILTAEQMAANTPPTSAPKTSDSSQVQAVSNAEPPGLIMAERSSRRADNGKDYIVTIKIKKANTKGFARYSDDAHENVQAKALKTDGSSFSISDGKIKFVWVNVPEKENLELSYILSGTVQHPIVLNGEYSYLEDNQSKKVLLKADTLYFESTSTPTLPSAEPEKEVVKEVVEEKEPKQANIQQEKKEGNASFKVQVGAFTNSVVDAAKLKRRFGISESISSEMQGGFSKFMVGSHNQYKNARGHRERMVNENGVKSAFVVAYNDGKRITVQEALMVSNQKWFK